MPYANPNRAPRDRPKRSTGELYDAIWRAALPRIMDERDPRAAAVSEPVARLILMAMARFTNPTRDQVLGVGRTWLCYASVQTIAELAGASDRQVQRVTRVFEDQGLLDRLRDGVRPGRPRKGESSRPARPNQWAIRPDRFAERALENPAGVVAISSNDDASEDFDAVELAENATGTGAIWEIQPVPVEVPSTPAGFPISRVDTGNESAEILPVSSPEPLNRLTRKLREPGTEPAREPRAVETENDRQLPLIQAVGLPALPPPTTATRHAEIEARLRANGATEQDIELLRQLDAAREQAI